VPDVKRIFLLGAALFAASAAVADFGQYRSHTVNGQSLLVSSDRGELRITAVDDAAFEVHYLETGVKQLPSFAIGIRTTDIVTALSESDETLAFMVDGLTAIVNKSPVSVSFVRDGEVLVAEESGYFAGRVAGSVSGRPRTLL